MPGGPRNFHPICAPADNIVDERTADRHRANPQNVCGSEGRETQETPRGGEKLRDYLHQDRHRDASIEFRIGTTAKFG
jgi:hypothetical protein